jgi:peroxiredoxin/mono/diheme cytochrome c family protein
MFLRRFLVGGFLTSSLVLVLTAHSDSPKSVEPGARVDDFSLADAYGQKRNLSDYEDRKLVVLAFLGTDCPRSRLYGPRLADLAKKYQPSGVAFLGISSNTQDNITKLKSFARIHGIEFPILKDLGNVLADRLGALRVPEVFLLDDQRVVRYRGRIDDQYGLQTNANGRVVAYQLSVPRRADLAIAIDELLAGKNVSVAQTDASGCLIGRERKVEQVGDVTYSKQIARVLNKHCVVCHREGQIGPFSLTGYHDAAGWAAMIHEVVAERRMPPWHADPRYGKFANDARLSDEERQSIARWVAAGAPEGDAKDLPEPPKFAEAWMIPQPDQVIHMSEPFTVPAEGTVEYQSFIVDPGWTEDKWVAAMEPRPGKPAVVHHIVMYVLPPRGVSKYYSANLPKTQLDWFASFAPGLRPSALPQGTARFIPAGSKLLFQMHYTPNGTQQQDRSYVGVKFADPRTVKREVAVQHAGTHDLQIPPGAANHEVESWYTFEQDSLLWSVSPHMHLRGKDFLYTLIYPDGKEEIVLNVPQYDFGWQTTYTLAEPKRVPQGSKLHCIAHFDNSENNLNNPDPTKEVRFGPQTWEEMMYGWFEICLADQDLSAELAKPSKDTKTGD